MIETLMLFALGVAVASLLRRSISTVALNVLAFRIQASGRDRLRDP